MSSSKLLIETFNDTGHSLCLLQPTLDIDQLLVQDPLAIGVHPLTNTPNFTSSISLNFFIIPTKLLQEPCKMHS